MDVIYGLIPSMIFIGLVLVGLIFWSIKSGQFEDFEGEGHRILMDEDLEPKPSTNTEDTTDKKEDSTSEQDK